VRIYTDGSYDGNTKRAGYKIYRIFFEEATPMSTDACHFDAEVAAIANAARKIAETPIFPLNKAKFQVSILPILSSKVTASQPSNSSPKQQNSIQQLFKNSLSTSTSPQQNKELRLEWIPSHCDILGNEKADFLANAATKKPPPQTSTLTFNIVKNRIKSALKKIFKRDKKKNPGNAVGGKR
jgi:ribonuclease HI